MEISVADGGTDDDAVVAHNSLKTQNLCAQRLHQHNGVGSHSITIVEFLRHSKYQNIIFFLSPVYIGTLICNLPADRHHLFGIAGIDGDLSGAGIQNCIAAEERMSHFLFHMHADLIKFIAHQASAVNRGKIRSVHNRRNVVACNTSPVCNSGCAVLVAAGISAIWISLYMSDQDWQVAFVHIFVHVYRISPVGGSKIHHMFLILAVMADDLSAVPEFVKQLFSENSFYIGLLASWMKAVGNNEQDILFLHACFIKLLQNIFDAHLSVAGRLLAAFYAVRHDNGNSSSLVRQF